jgi:hypothetical protein
MEIDNKLYEGRRLSNRDAGQSPFLHPTGCGRKQLGDLSAPSRLCTEHKRWDVVAGKCVQKPRGKARQAVRVVEDDDRTVTPYRMIRQRIESFWIGDLHDTSAGTNGIICGLQPAAVLRRGWPRPVRELRRVGIACFWTLGRDRL